MIVVAGTVRIDPAKVDLARGEMAKMIAASRSEDGCFGYSYAIDVLDPSVVRVFEAWRDLDALGAHFKSAHIAAWRASWPSLGVRDRALDAYDVASVTPL